MIALDRLVKAIADAIRPDPKVKISQWAEENRVLPADTPEPGPWRNSRTPHLVDIMDTMSAGSGFREGWLKKGVQLGGSATGENFIGAAVCTAAGSILMVFPTIEDAKQWELQRFEPMRLATRALRRRVRDSDSKKADNTKLRKKYPGGVMRLVSANRVGALKSATIRYIKFEEPDEYVMDLGNQGNPINLARRRASNFGNKARIYGDGTPTIEGASAIDDEYKRGDQRKRFMRCPHCDHAQFFEWRQMKWKDDDAASTQYACIDCGALAPEHVWKGGKNWERPGHLTEAQCKEQGYAYWEATAKGQPGIASWHLPSLYAPLGWRPWVDLVVDWLGIQGDPVKLKDFFNNQLAECYQDRVNSAIGAEHLQARAENYALMHCPQGGLVVLAGVDTQDNRLAIVIRAYGRGGESWGLHHGEIYGNPADPQVWVKLRELLEAPIRHASGQVLRVDAAAIDSGGHHTEDVYAFCRDAQLRGKHWFAIKGAKAYDAAKLGRPKSMEFTWRGQPVPGGAELRQVGTQAIKNLIDGRLRINNPGAGYFHFPLGFELDYYKQMRAEKREWRRDQTGNKALWWVKGSERNEAWDCEVYAYAAFLYALSGRHEEAFFRAREKLLVPAVPDLFDPASALTVADAGAAMHGLQDQDVAEQAAADAQPAEPDEQSDFDDAALPAVRRRTVLKTRPRRGFAQRW